MQNTNTPGYTLHNGDPIPKVGLGVWEMSDAEAEHAVLSALEAGYRLIDTASIYGNEKGVGKALKTCGIPREEIFVTTKLAVPDQGYETTLKAIDTSLKLLELDYVDLYLDHWPFSVRPGNIKGIHPPNKREETWRAMEEILSAGKARAIGVSNYAVKHLEQMKSYATVIPVVNQVEFHPFLYQKDLLAYCTENKIRIEAYCPLVHGKKIQDPRISEIAKKYGKTNAQIMLRWSIQHGLIPLPKSTHEERIRENIGIFDFELADLDMQSMDALHEGYRIASDPDKIDP